MGNSSSIDSRQQWICLQFRAGKTEVPAIREHLDSLSSLGWEERSEAEATRFVLYFSRRRRAEQMGRNLQHLRDAEQLDIHSVKISESVYSGDDWVRQYRKSFKGFPVESHFFIHPPWERSNSEYPINLIIEPASAFGTGTHESTQLALSFLPKALKGALRILDLGTGSGILAAAAKKISPTSTILALDTDASVFRVARKTCLENGVDVIFAAGGAEVVTGSFDLIMANLTGPTLCMLAPRLQEKSQNLVISGFTDSESEFVQACFEACSMRVVKERQLNHWTAFQLSS